MPPCPPTQRRGYSLLEMVLAVALVGGTLVPAMALMRDGMELSRTIDERQLLANYAVQQLERRLAIVAADSDWADAAPDTSPDDGAIADAGVPSIRYRVTWTDDALEGGLPDQLMHITSTAYLDTDGDLTPDADEPQSVFRTKIAKLLTYENKAETP